MDNDLKFIGLEEHRLTFKQASYLYQLHYMYSDFGEPVAVNKLAQEVGQTTSNLNRELRKQEARGFIKLVRHNGVNAAVPLYSFDDGDDDCDDEDNLTLVFAPFNTAEKREKLEDIESYDEGQGLTVADAYATLRYVLEEDADRKYQQHSRGYIDEGKDFIAYETKRIREPVIQSLLCGLPEWDAREGHDTATVSAVLRMGMIHLVDQLFYRLAKSNGRTFTPVLTKKEKQVNGLHSKFEVLSLKPRVPDLWKLRSAQVRHCKGLSAFRWKSTKGLTLQMSTSYFLCDIESEYQQRIKQSETPEEAEAFFEKAKGIIESTVEKERVN
ncbi:hypothetical protein [Ferrimonas sp. YFM]|uniref:hypothetical protein n=1 Tax=Ferrimonas sp. YFM TaxID=3028878 RepID=UPI0025735C7F|nr:hypothetical protein [Ferrimonas sp. YFM]BDY05389.1 hypothetical protein F0521_24300 [Ferrimonas sp. YFM]